MSKEARFRINAGAMEMSNVPLISPILIFKRVLIVVSLFSLTLIPLKAAKVDYSILHSLDSSLTLLDPQTKLVAYESETLTVPNSSTPFSTSKVQSTTDNTKNAESAIFTVNCNAGGTTCVLRFALDGATPTTSAGLRALYGDTVNIIGHANVVAFRGIRETATTCLLDTVYFRAQ